MADIDFWDVMVMLKLQYPQLAAIVDQPGIREVALQAMGEEWPQERLQQAIRDTEYFKNTPAEQRTWAVQKVLDPATTWQKLQALDLGLRDVMKQTGITIPGANALDPFVDNAYMRFLDQAAYMGWNTQDMKYALSVQHGEQSQPAGELATNMAGIKHMADDYGVPLSDQALHEWGIKKTAGIMDEASLRGYIMEQSKSLFPGLTDAIDRGITVRQYADPYLQIAQQELGINPDVISLTDSKWNSALNQIDPSTGQRVSMSLSDWTNKIRSDGQYGYDQTEQARSKGAQLAGNLAQIMGAIR